jgi:hypothetical protein
MSHQRDVGETGKRGTKLLISGMAGLRFRGTILGTFQPACLRHVLTIFTMMDGFPSTITVYYYFVS